jgi:hypothetical protein
MLSQSNFRRVLAVAASCALAACTAASGGMGTDRSSGSDASQVTWQDGQPAYAISCKEPGGCQERALAICSGRNMTTLKSENMPTTGTARAALGPPSIVIRCG